METKQGFFALYVIQHSFAWLNQCYWHLIINKTNFINGGELLETKYTGVMGGRQKRAFATFSFMASSFNWKT